jgi:hypothetical protein
MKQIQIAAILLCIFYLIHTRVAAQNVGIGTAAPKARLHVADSSVVFTGPVPLPANPGEPPVGNFVSAMMWYADKAAFRVGYSNQNVWSKDRTGQYSFASGYQSEASGLIATAVGQSSARGTLSLAGILGTAEGDQSLALGFFAHAGAQRSMAVGHFVKAKGVESTVMGILNDTNVVNSLFEIGNGIAPDTRRNAMTVVRSGNVGINTIDPTEKLHIAGKLRIEDGTQGVNKVLTSDANGVATWVALSETDPQVGTNTTNYLSKWNGSALVNSTVFDNGTNVGIGTTIPSNKLDVFGAGGVRVSTNYNGTGPANDWIAGNFGGILNNRVVLGMLTNTATIGGHNAALNAWATLAINPDGGNVGIGTFTPSNKLSVAGNANVTGNLGIGTTTPAAKLDVNGTVKIGTNGSVIQHIFKQNVSHNSINVAANSTAFRSYLFAVPFLESTIIVSPAQPLPPGVSIYASLDDGADNSKVVSVHFVNGTGVNVVIPASQLFITLIN